MASRNLHNFPFSSLGTLHNIPNQSSHLSYTEAQGNPFISPQPSYVSSEGQSGNTSEQDEFHLERYSEDLKEDNRTRAQSAKAEENIGTYNQQETSRKRPRPGLNIVTNFSSTAAKAHTDGLVLDRVRTNQPRLGQRPDLTTRSQTAEHVYQDTSSRTHNGPDFVSLEDLVGLRAKADHRKKTDKRGILGDKVPNKKVVEVKTDHQSDGGFERFAHGPGKAGNVKRSLKGKSAKDGNDLNGPYKVTSRAVPDGALSNRLAKGQEHSLTPQLPLTPTILITPAEDLSPWSGDVNGARRRRPTSSVYSEATHANLPYCTSTDMPPVPSLPNEFGPNGDGKERQKFTMSRESWEMNSSQPERASSASTLFDEDETVNTKFRPRAASTESTAAILPSDIDSARPQSKGWWNLALSPLLSRAGTLVGKKSAPAHDVLPPMPDLSAKSRAEKSSPQENEKGHKSPVLPEDTRGLARDDNRASTWSQWTTWEQEREKGEETTLDEADSREIEAKGHKVQESSASVPFMLGLTPVTQGLSQEYFHACVIDEALSGPYFECQNHSCLEKLPKLVSYQQARTPENGITETVQQIKTKARQEVADGEGSNTDNRLRSDSDSTIIEDEPDELSPNVRKATAAPFVRVKPGLTAFGNSQTPASNDRAGVPLSDEALESAKAQKTTKLPAYSPPRAQARLQKHVAVMPPVQQSVVASPGPLSPEMHRAMTSQGAVLMSEVRPAPMAPIFINNYTNYPEPMSAAKIAAVSLSDIERPVTVRQHAEARRRALEKEDEIARKAGGLWRGRGCLPKNGCFGRSGSEGRKRRRWYVAIGVGMLLLVIGSIALATQITRKGDDTPIQSQWLNLTGFPPIQTGILTIARPDAAVENSGCVQPSTMWSCAVAREDQASLAPNDPDQPNFRIEIRFRNGTVPNNETIPVSNSTSAKRWQSHRGRAVHARQSDPFTNELFTPMPSPPPIAEQDFLGNTTDNITSPFSGDPTPFFITFLSTVPVLPSAFNSTSSLTRRQSLTTSNSTAAPSSAPSSAQSSPIPVPAPSLTPSNTAAPANLLPNNPLPYSQPLRLYNRGLPTEHYGFYTYFDRAIFLRSVNASDTDPEDAISGGALEADANWRCTFSQTRFLVRIWTNPSFGGTLLNNGTSSALSNPAPPTTANLSATDFTAPGSFPYPVSITLDRHGGDRSAKGVYCYAIDPATQHIIEGAVPGSDLVSPVQVPEGRGVDGHLVNPAPGTFDTGDGADDGFDTNAGGVDGGTGGCECEWRNWSGEVGGNV